MNKMNTLLAPCALTLMGGAAMTQEVTLKLGHLANEDNIWHRGFVRFAKKVDTLTEGRVAVEIYPNAPLGKKFTPIKRQALGTADMTISGESLQNWAPMAALLALHYAYQSLEHIARLPQARSATGSRPRSSRRPISDD